MPITASNNPYPDSPDANPEKLSKGGYEGTAQDLSEEIDAVLSEATLLINNTLVGSASVGSIVPSSIPPATGAIHAFATQAGTYTNWGGFVIPANTFAFISRSASLVFSISQTTLDVAGKVNVSDVVNTLISTETAKPLSAAQGKILNEKNVKIKTWTAIAFASGDQVNHLGKDWVSNAATLSTDVPGVSSKWVDRLIGYNPIITYQRTGNNLFDKTTTVQGSYDGGGSSVTNAVTSRTDFISVKPSTKYFRTNLNYQGNVYHYTSAKVFISSGVAGDGSFTTPVNGAYIRINITFSSEFSQKDLLMINEGSALLPYESYTEQVVSVNGKAIRNADKDFLKLGDSYLKSESDLLNVLKSSVLSTSVNLFDKTTTIQGSYIDNGGSSVTNAVTSRTDFIAVKPSTKYFRTNLNYQSNAFYYTSAKVFISQSPASSGFTTPSNCAYIRINITFSSEFSQKDLLMINEGSALLPYESYTEQVVSVNGKAIRNADKDFLKLGDSYLKSESDLLNVLKSSVLSTSVNLFDKTTTIQGSYIDNAGVATTYAPSSRTDFIAVKPSVNYSKTNLNYQGNTFFYTSAKVFISSVGGTSFITPSNCAYIRMSITFTSEFTQKDLLMINEGAVLLPYQPFLLKAISVDDKPIRNADIEVYAKTETYSKSEVDTLSFNKNKLVVKKTGNLLYIRSYWDDAKDLIQVFLISVNNPVNNNNPSEFSNVYVIPNTTLNSAIETTISTSNVVHTSSENAAPPSYNGTYMGANHGPNFGLKVTLSAHGKTSADIGSVWNDSVSTKFYLIQILDANNLVFLSDNTGVGDLWSFKESINGTLSHFLGATNTTSVATTTQSLYQLESVLQNQEKLVFIDGVKITADGMYLCNSLEVRDNYDIADLPSILEYVKTNKVSIFNNSSIAKSSRLSIVYKFAENGACTIYQYFRNYKEIALSYLGFIQQEVLTGTNVKIFRLIPDSSSFVGTTKTWNYDRVEEITGTTDGILLNSANYKTANKPPYRFIDYTSNTTTSEKIVGFAFGYSPIRGLSKLGVRNSMLTNAFSTSSTKKMYPRMVDLKVNVGGKIAANQMYEGVAFRHYFNPNINPNTTAVSLYKDGTDWILMLDYHQVVSFDKITIPTYLIGKNIEVIEKTTNATIHNSIIESDGFYVSIDNSISPVVGYLVLRIF